MFKKWKMKNFEKKLQTAGEKHDLGKDISDKYQEISNIADHGDAYYALIDLKQEITKEIRKAGRFPVERMIAWPLLAVVDGMAYVINETLLEDLKDNSRSLKRRFSKDNKELGSSLRYYKNKVESDIKDYAERDSMTLKIIESARYNDIASAFPEMRKAFLRYARNNGDIKHLLSSQAGVKIEKKMEL